MEAMHAVPLPGPFGLAVSGCSAYGLSDDGFRQAADLLFANRVLVFDRQEIDLAAYVRFGKRWGEPVLLIAKKNRREDYPELIVQSNSAAVPPPLRNVANHWHCDSSYEDVAATVTMLLGVKAPSQGGETLFADMVAAFQDLSPSVRARFEKLSLRHAVSAARPGLDERIVQPQDLPTELSADTAVPAPVVHPLVKRHPVTGRKALYGLGGSPFAVVGMEDADGARLIEELKQHATQDRFVQSCKLLPGQIMMWDNFSVMHRATHIEYSNDPAQERLNYRISLKGLPAFMLVAAGEQADASGK